MKLLEKRLARYRSKQKDLSEEIVELDNEVEKVEALIKPNKKSKNSCPDCGKELIITELPHGNLILCSNCLYKKVRKSK